LPKSESALGLLVALGVGRFVGDRTPVLLTLIIAGVWFSFGKNAKIETNKTAIITTPMADFVFLLKCQGFFKKVFLGSPSKGFGTKVVVASFFFGLLTDCLVKGNILCAI
jgi:hypothetical protein